MTAVLLDGKGLAQTMQAEIAAQTQELLRTRGLRPGLAAVLVGDNPASQIYVRNKRRACDKAGIASFLHELPANTSEADLLALIGRLNADPAVHGILVQLPLPPHIREAAVIDAVSSLKDVDGFSPLSLGLLAAGRPRFLACTPNGVLQLLVRNNIKVAGSHVVAIGQPRFVKAEMVRPGAAVIDVGIHQLPDGTRSGDVDFDSVREVASAITPVPGGVGPMTITMLLHNTLQAAKISSEPRP